jgi:threonine dehydratase
VGVTLTIDRVRAAQARIEGAVTRTPTLSSPKLDQLLGCTLHLKAENLQLTGSFKLRGALNRVTIGMQRSELAGVVAASSGNHAGAVSLAAMLHGVRCCVVVPHDAPAVKVAAAEEFGAEIVRYDRNREDRTHLARLIARERDYLEVPAFDDYDVMAGQGTLALELLEDAGPLDDVVVPVGGGGLMAGCGTVVKSLAPSTRVIGVEPSQADDTAQSIAQGRRVAVADAYSIADGLRIASPGKLTFPINQRVMDEIRTVSEEEIGRATYEAVSSLGVDVEPSGATALAAIVSDPARFRGRRVGVVVSGGNADAGLLEDLRRRYA